NTVKLFASHIKLKSRVFCPCLCHYVPVHLFRTDSAYGTLMARSVRNAKIDTRSARSRCETRREPYWAKLSTGRYVGYRRTSRGVGTWIARYRDDQGRQHYEALGAADDAVEADGQSILTFNQAQERARRYFEEVARRLSGHDAPTSGPYTVETALREYLAH